MRCPGSPIAVTVCDILPEAEELRALMADYDAHRPLDFWVPLIQAPERRERLGASAWKPQYRVAMREGEPAHGVLPGHLVVGDAAASRRGFIYRSFELAYRSRNRSLFYRYFYIVTHLLLHLLHKDLRQLRHFRLPAITLTVIQQAAIIVTNLGRGTMTSEEMARRFRLIFVQRAHRERYPNRQGRLPIMPGLGLAKDMDTQEEADEVARKFEPAAVEETK